MDLDIRQDPNLGHPTNMNDDEMASQQTPQEIRAEVLAEDSMKDVNFNCGITIATFAGISSAAAVLAVLSIGFLEEFRGDVAMLWLCCVPFIFPVFTGVSVAYRKQLAAVGVHIALMISTGLTGGAGYGLSIEPVYLDRNNCTTVDEKRGDCHREVLVHIYLIAGAVAAGFAVLGLLLSLCVCSNSMKRKAKRERDQARRLLKNEENKNKTVQHVSKKAGLPLSQVMIQAPTASPPVSFIVPSPLQPSYPSQVQPQTPIRQQQMFTTAQQLEQQLPPSPNHGTVAPLPTSMHPPVVAQDPVVANGVSSFLPPAPATPQAIIAHTTPPSSVTVAQQESQQAPETIHQQFSSSVAVTPQQHSTQVFSEVVPSETASVTTPLSNVYVHPSSPLATPPVQMTTTSVQVPPLPEKTVPATNAIGTQTEYPPVNGFSHEHASTHL